MPFSNQSKLAATWQHCLFAFMASFLSVVVISSEYWSLLRWDWKYLLAFSTILFKNTILKTAVRTKWYLRTAVWREQWECKIMHSGIPCSSLVLILHWDKTLFNPAFTEINELSCLSSVALNFFFTCKHHWDVWVVGS